MASDKGTLQLRFPKELIECPVCFGTFNEPKVLTCQHTFCLACLDRFLRTPDDRLTCPICRQTTALPPNGTSAHLPTNYFLVHLLDVVAKQTSAVDGKDEDVCTSQVRAEEGYCCADHPTVEVVFYCRDCDASICMRCAFLRHRTHDCADVREKADECRREIERLVENLSQNSFRFQASMQELRRSLELFREMVRDIRRQIAVKTEDVVRCIRRQEKSLLATVNGYENQFTAPVELSAKDVESKLREMETFEQFCRQLKDFGADADVIRLSSQLVTTGDEFQAMPIVETTLPDLIFTPSTKQVGEINLLGDITVRESDDRGELLTSHLATESSCGEDSSSSMQPAGNDSLAATATMRLEGIQDIDSADIASNRQNLNAQESLKSNDDGSEDSSERSDDRRHEDGYWSTVNDGLQRDNGVVPTSENNYSIVEDVSTKIVSHDSRTGQRGDATLQQKQQQQKQKQQQKQQNDRRGKGLVVGGGVDTIAGKEPVAGIAVLLDRLYVLRLASNRLERYDLRTLRPVDPPLQLDGVQQPTDLGACAPKQTLYIGHTKQVVFGLKVAQPSNNSTPRRLPVAFGYRYLSVTSDSSVLIGCPTTDTILEYRELPVWTELRRICIPGSYPTCMVQIASNFFVVSSKMNVLYFVEFNGSRGGGGGVTYRRVSSAHNISYVAADACRRRRLLVANRYGHGVLKLDVGPSSSSASDSVRSSPVVEPKTISQPVRLSMDKTSRRLFVGTAHGDVKIINFHEEHKQSRDREF